MRTAQQLADEIWNARSLHNMKLLRRRQLFAAIREAKSKKETQVVLQDAITGGIFTLPLDDAMNSHARLLAIVERGQVSHENRPLL